MPSVQGGGREIIMNEKDLLEQLKQSAESIDPPESLSPENIEKMLKATRKDTADSHKADRKSVV